jgi:hypothetical protein
VWKVVDFASEDVTRRLRDFYELNTRRLVSFLESEGVASQVQDWLAEYESNEGEMIQDAYGRRHARYLKGGMHGGGYGSTSTAVRVMTRASFVSAGAFVGYVVVSERRRRGTYHNNDAYYPDKCKVRDEDQIDFENRCRNMFVLVSEMKGNPQPICHSCMECRTQKCIQDTHQICETFVSETHVDCQGESLDVAPLRYSFTIVVLSLLELMDKITEL